MTFIAKDTSSLKEKGILPEQIVDQLAILKNGIPYVDLRAPATIGHGLYTYSAQEQKNFISLFESKKESLDLLKFTPASGAATRMFKFLFAFLDDYNPEIETINAYINRNDAQDLRLFFVGLDRFPFYSKIRNALAKKYPDDVANINDNRQRFVQMMLDEQGLNFGNTPKGLFPFHSYKMHNVSAFEEHLFEASLYAKSKGKARLHFTISKEHHQGFKEKFQECKEKIEVKTNTVFDISYSFQKPSTDTIAVNFDNEPIRNAEGGLCFRPGGHGSLIENLNEQSADIIFIKNIDNVVV